jgi:hypothetical protein
MRTEQYCRNRSLLPWLTRAQRFHCLRVQNEFIQDIIDTDELGPCLKIEYFFDANHPTPSVPPQEFAKDLTKGSQIILQLAYWYSNELHANGLFFDNGKAKWERIEVSSTYWAAGVNYDNTIKPQ